MGQSLTLCRFSDLSLTLFAYSRPFHVAIGIMTCRMLMHLHKAVVLSRISLSRGTIELSASGSSGSRSRSDPRLSSMIHRGDYVSDPDLSVSSQATMEWFVRSGTETTTMMSDRSAWEESDLKKSFGMAREPRVHVVNVSAAKRSQTTTYDATIS